MSSPAEYLARHQPRLEQAVSKAFSRVAVEQPADPMAWVGEFLMTTAAAAAAAASPAAATFSAEPLLLSARATPVNDGGPGEGGSFQQQVRASRVQFDPAEGAGAMVHPCDPPDGRTRNVQALERARSMSTGSKAQAVADAAEDLVGVLEEMQEEIFRLQGTAAAVGAENERLRAELDALKTPARAALVEQRAFGEVRGVNAMNDALWRLHAFKHEPPRFEYFDPVISEQISVDIKEVPLAARPAPSTHPAAPSHRPRHHAPPIPGTRAPQVRLPLATETHELCFEPTTRCLFVSQMSNSVLVRIPVGPDGLLLNDQDAWRIGEIPPPSPRARTLR